MYDKRVKALLWDLPTPIPVSEGMEATWESGVASLHLGHAAAGSSHQQSEHVSFFNPVLLKNSSFLTVHTLYIFVVSGTYYFLSGK